MTINKNLKWWCCYRPGCSKGWPQSFPTLEAAQAFIEENGWETLMHPVVSTYDLALSYLPESGS